MHNVEVPPCTLYGVLRIYERTPKLMEYLLLYIHKPVTAALYFSLFLLARLLSSAFVSLQTTGRQRVDSMGGLCVCFFCDIHVTTFCVFRHIPRQRCVAQTLLGFYTEHVPAVEPESATLGG